MDEYNYFTKVVFSLQIPCVCLKWRNFKWNAKLVMSPGGGGVLPYMGYIGMCRCEGYGFQAVYSRIGYVNKSVWVYNRVSFFRKLISWLKILSRQGKQLLWDRWGLGEFTLVFS